MKNFWQKLKKKNKPIYALAPMAGVADSAFRQICKSFGADVVYSEMISATAIVYNSKKTLELMKFDKKERPYVVQLFGSKPDHFAQAAKFITKKIKPDGIDINFGCPVKKVARQGAGAVLMKDFKLARRAIEAVINNTNLPVSIKIRSEVDKATALDFLKSLAGLDIKAVMIHGRSLKQGNSGEVNWRIIRQARKYFKGVILANGGVVDKKTAGELLAATGADGVGIGQGALGKPWIFSQLATCNQQPATKGLIFRTAMKHARLAEKLKGRQGIIEMRKHLCWYVSGLANAGKLRKELVKAESLEDIKKVFSIVIAAVACPVLDTGCRNPGVSAQNKFLDCGSSPQ
ncbi:MAG: tRNA-dihydrouridine synthase [Patescibacteria group bacterium]|nr:tRNA-dihydrouridine synthase [Patescibacteria group bacterium]